MKAKTERKATQSQVNASSPDHSVWVSANAGSGKTQVLVDRVIKLLLAGAEPSTILCITFTKAAAAEMSLRLFGRLSSWTSMSAQELEETI
ncbi:MAG: UvrD-helicase domain-containing protein, partial [Aestuariivirga sp.]